MAQAAIKAVDIGLPQLAMHSAVETAGSMDVEDLVKVLQVFCEK
ncbi:m18 family aminopeptidase [Firmicutes bacterium CAG:534]|nr:m18 family aminopeptidase [Firmicutes bacterium CAG:534]